MKLCRISTKCIWGIYKIASNLPLPNHSKSRTPRSSRKTTVLVLLFPTSDHSTTSWKRRIQVELQIRTRKSLGQQVLTGRSILREGINHTSTPLQARTSSRSYLYNRVQVGLTRLVRSMGSRSCCYRSVSFARHLRATTRSCWSRTTIWNKTWKSNCTNDMINYFYPLLFDDIQRWSFIFFFCRYCKDVVLQDYPIFSHCQHWLLVSS